MESTSNIKHFLKKSMIVIANVFAKLEFVKILLRALCKKCRFRKRFDTQHVKVFQKLAKSPSEQFYSVF